MLDWGESASFSIWFKDAATQEYLPQTPGSPPSPPATSKESFVNLDPDYIYGTVFYEKLRNVGVEKSGEFLIVGEYHSPVPSNMSFGLPIWSRDMGSVRSNIVRINVTD
jgi:hypothetical protein